MRSNQVTILDIAKQLNISKSTVSRALTNHPKVRSNTRQKVLQLAEKLGYQINTLPVGLRTNKTKTIGVVVPEFSSSFYPQVAVAIQEEASKYGYSVLISQCNEDYATEVANSKIMLANHVNGVLVSVTKETMNYEHWKIFVRRNIPIVFFDRICNEVTVPKVVVNDNDVAFKAVEHLIAIGRKRIVYLGGTKKLLTNKARLDGYKGALLKHCIPLDEDLIVDFDLNLNKVKMYVKFLLDLEMPIDAIFAVSDPIAMEVIQVLKKMKKRVPEDIAIVGFGDNYGSSFAEPALTTIKQPVKEIGQVAMKLLLELMDKDTSEWKSVTHTLNAELVVRNSTVSTSALNSGFLSKKWNEVPKIDPNQLSRFKYIKSLQVQKN